MDLTYPFLILCIWVLGLVVAVIKLQERVSRLESKDKP